MEGGRGLRKKNYRNILKSQNKRKKKKTYTNV